MFLTLLKWSKWTLKVGICGIVRSLNICCICQLELYLSFWPCLYILSIHTGWLAAMPCIGVHWALDFPRFWYTCTINVTSEKCCCQIYTCIYTTLKMGLHSMYYNRCLSFQHSEFWMSVWKVSLLGAGIYFNGGNGCFLSLIAAASITDVKLLHSLPWLSLLFKV